jgi:hypothetical protein
MAAHLAHDTTPQPARHVTGQSFRKTSFARKITALSALSAILAGSAALVANAADEVGTSVRIVNTVTGSQGNRQLVNQDPVFEKEKISAAADSHGEILLSDNSKVLVGENSVISLDDFVVGAKGFESGTIKVAKGAFRFITGNSKKGAFKVQTPVSTIGVRGTIFDIYITDLGVVQHVLFNGEIEVCIAGGQCLTIDDPCDIIEATSSTVEKKPYYGSIGNRDDQAGQFLTYLQGRFTQPWRAPTFTCATRALLDPFNKVAPGAPDHSKGDPDGNKTDDSDNDRGRPRDSGSCTSKDC